jgi:hypothetical protein
MVLVISLPCCLLLPDGDYPVKLADNDIVKLNLTKVIPKVYDERLPFRGFLKGELDNISKLRIMFKNESKEVDIADLPKIKERGIIIKYFDKNGKEIVPEFVKNDVNLQESDIVGASLIRRLSRDNPDNIPQDWIDQFTKQEQYHGRRILINGEIKKDRYGRFRYTKVKYSSTKQLHYDKEFVRAIKAINILIDVYRIETQEYWITNVIEDEIFIYKDVSEDSGQMVYSMKGFTQKREDHDLGTVNEIRNNLLNREIPSPYFLLILDAMKALDDSKYYLSIIYAITALESIVKTYIIIYSKRNAFQEKVIDNLLNLRLQLLLTTILRIFVNSKEFDDELITRIQKGITLRNKIIHESNLDISKETANDVINNVKKIVNILIFDLDESVKNKKTS